ncbi:hypothetical protein QQF64_016234 [Cirrhinus molitorella]|uniref:Uncharacterized protein n=1 Tax=Cirrhinus molitorella TaxID=172907 RepID=A0ABR3LNX2_9TELE
MQKTQGHRCTLSYLWLYNVCERSDGKRSGPVSSQRKYGPSGSLRLRDVSIESGVEKEAMGQHAESREEAAEEKRLWRKALELTNSPATGVLRP